MRNIDKTVVGLVFALVLDVGNPAFAYLDPGTGSMILQLLLGGVAAALVVGRAYLQRVRGFFSRQNKSPSIEAEDNK